MVKKDKYGMTFEQYPEHKQFLDKVNKLGFNPEYFFYTRHTQFIPDGCPPCDICGGNKLIHGVGRYISFDEDREDDLAIFICGYCLNHLEEWGIKTDMQ